MDVIKMKRKFVTSLVIFMLGSSFLFFMDVLAQQGLPQAPLMTINAPRTALPGQEITIRVTVKNTIGTGMYDGKVYIDTLMIPGDVLKYLEIIVKGQELPHLMEVNDEATVTLKIKTTPSIPAMRLEIPIVLDVMEGSSEGGLVPFVSDPYYVYIDIPPTSSTTPPPTTTSAPTPSKFTAGKHKISEEKLKILYDNYHCGGGIYEYSDLNLELSHRFTADSIDEPLTLEELSNYDILVISHPTLKYTSSEVRAIKEFVGEGGSLLLMGNGWAWADYNNKPMKDFPFNKIAKEFGVTVNDDIIGDPTNYHTPGDEGNTIFTNFAVHPVTEDLTKVYGGLCSSLSITGDAVPIVMGDEDSYSGYHPGPYKAGDYPPVVAALEYVKGRVIFIGKDGFITNEDLDKYDNLKLGMNIFTWLAGDMSTLHIDCLSGVATIYLGGKNLGETPVEVELEKGNYKVRVVKEGYEEYMFEISVKGGEKKNISVSLQKILGKLSIVSDPSATVYINEEKKGTTPLNLELDSGKYEIKIEKENYETYTETIELSSGETKTISVNLTKITPAPTTTPALTTSVPTTSPPTTTAPPKRSNTLLYIGIFVIVIVLVLGAYYMGKKKK